MKNMFPGKRFVISSILSFSFLIVSSSSSCSRCRGYAVELFAGQYTLKEQYLKGYNFTSMFVTAKNECVLSCIEDFCQCASINFKESQEKDGTHHCELNYETRSSTNNNSLVPKKDNLYMDLIAYNTVSYYTS